MKEERKMVHDHVFYSEALGRDLSMAEFAACEDAAREAGQELAPLLAQLPAWGRASMVNAMLMAMNACWNCGGPLRTGATCLACQKRREWFRQLGRPKDKSPLGDSHVDDPPFTAGDLKAWLEDVPDDATVTLTSFDAYEQTWEYNPRLAYNPANNKVKILGAGADE